MTRICYRILSRARRRSLLLALVTSVVMAGGAMAAESAPISMAEVEQAVLAADTGTGSLKDNWTPVVQLLTAVNVQTPDPVLRMIKGHACLAVNENNESVCLFLSVVTPEDRQQWLQWAEGFARRQPAMPVAHYFHGDAFARVERWEDAVSHLTIAIEKAKDKQHALSFNARGVVRARMALAGSAMEDFLSATDTANELADAYCNLGALAVQAKEGAQGAEVDFGASISNSPGYALAHFGRGCARMIIGDLENAQADLAESTRSGSAATALVAAAAAKTQKTIRDQAEARLALASKDNPGFSLDSRTINALEQGKWGFQGAWAKTMIAQHSDNPVALQQIHDAMNKAGSAFEAYVPRYFGQVREDTARMASLDSVINSAKIDAGISGKTVASGAELGASMDASLASTAVHKFGELQQLQHQKIDNLSQFATGAANSGGFRTSATEEGSIDAGNWPFVVPYGLLYGHDFDSSLVAPEQVRSNP